jgi:Gas vesicle protein.
MEPTRTDQHALVELLDVLLEEGVIIQADIVVTVADIPLVGISLRAAIAGMAKMSEYGVDMSWSGA